MSKARAFLPDGHGEPAASSHAQAWTWQLRLGAGRALGAIRSPGRALRRQLLLHGLDGASLLGNQRLRKVARHGWSVRRFVAGLPGCRRAWDALRPLFYQPRTRVVPVDRVLLGGRNALRSAEHARRSGDLLYSSTPLPDSALVQLLQQYDKEGEAMLTADRLRETGYFARARQFVELDGHYCGAVDDHELLGNMREFIDSYRGVAVTPRTDHRSSNGRPFVRRVRYSDCYATIDGHHRLAIAAAKGAEEVEVIIGLGSTTTALQDLLLGMPWLGGQRELYQPIDAPELETWTLIRRCEDRLGMAREFLASRGWLPEPADRQQRYLDVGSSYGWFVAEMASLGYQTHGVEADPGSEELGRIVYGLRPGQVTVGEASEFLRGVEQPFEVVSCFSVLHHFALGRGPCTAAELMHLLSSATSRVLFFDTGEAHESGIRRTLPDWTADYVRGWILDNSGFSEVIPLGIDDDARTPYDENYGRTLFACVR